MPVSLQIESHRRQLSRNADDLLRFARRARKEVGLRGTVSVLLQSSERMQAMNRYYRHKDKPTDVLSFPPTATLRELHSGDIAISADIAAESARALGHSLANEIKVLILHGMLHLAGHDHETDSGEMAREESRLRAGLRLPQSLIERAHAKPTTTPRGKAAARRKPARIPARINVRLASSSRARKKARAAKSARS